MLKALEEILDRVRTWPNDRQEEAARLLAALENSSESEHQRIDVEIALVEVGLAQAKRGEFVSDADMDAFWKRNRR